MKNYHFKYGSTSVDLPLNEKNVVAELYGNKVEPIEDIEKAVYTSLANPIGESSLNSWIEKGKPVTLIISDMSRFWMRQDLVIPAVVKYLNEECDIKDSDITILVANGTHIGGDEAELRTLVTDDIYNRISVLNHDCKADDLVHIGTTTRGTDVVINPLAVNRQVVAIGAATQHVMAGFGGGRKSILPGIVSLKTINQNHSHSLDPLAPQSNPAIGNAVLEGNPLHEDMCEAASMVERLYIINLVMNADMKLARIFSGHWLESWKEACKSASEMYEAPIKELADVVITSSGGYPKDMSLYQGTKTIDNVCSGLKDGGTLVILMECREGGGPAEYFDWIKPLIAGTIDADLRKNFTIPGYIFYLNCEQSRRFNICMLTSVKAETLAPMGIKAYGTVDELLADIDIDGKKTYIIPNGSTVIPTIMHE